MGIENLRFSIFFDAGKRFHSTVLLPSEMYLLVMMTMIMELNKYHVQKRITFSIEHKFYKDHKIVIHDLENCRM